jgi:DNA sulfur modification protein DndD
MRNFKRFYGYHEIDLLSQPEAGKPLILIGGDNGRGKTSIHEAINYVFYEDGDLPGIQTRPNYLRAVSDRLNHRALDEGQTDYSTAVDLIVAGGDADRQFHIERSWKVDVGERRALQPVLTILENGRPIDWIEDNPTAYQDFLRRVLPPRIAPFFFFDGERIQQFAEEESHDRRMIEAIEDILHITVYKMLRDDLRKYVVEHIEKFEVKMEDTGDFFKLQEDAERIEKELDQKRDKLGDIDREVDEANREQRTIEDELRRVASPHASKRDDLLLERTQLEQELEQAKVDLQKSFEPLPILLTGKLRLSLEGTLHEEQQSITNPEQIEQLQKQLNLIEERVFVSPLPPPPSEILLDEDQRKYYRALYNSVSRDILGLNPSSRKETIHDLSTGERQVILGRLAQVQNKADFLREAISRRERLSNELRDTETKILSTSDDPHVAELIKENRAVSERIGRLDKEKENLTGQIQRLEADLAVRKRQISERVEQRAKTSDAVKIIKHAKKAQKILDEFIRQLAPEKLEILKHHFQEMYSRLRKPEDPVSSIEIDSDTWQVKLLDERGRILERRVFSAGMREMYALALLWALSRASGRELPIVIDTPVARLDTTNRRVLFEKYLPHAGHQVIVLSTDTEVDVKWAEKLSPFVAKQYRLDHDPSTSSTVIRPGYFF